MPKPPARHQRPRRAPAPTEATLESGVAVAVVKQNKDHTGLGRVKVTYPWHSEPQKGYWARVATPMAGKGRGIYFIPEVEDEVLVGGNTGIYEGAVIKKGAVIGAGTVITGSTPVYDLPNGTIIKPGPDTPVVIPERAVVVPGARAVTVGAGVEWRLSLATPVIVKYRDDKTDTRTELERWIR